MTPTASAGPRFALGPPAPIPPDAAGPPGDARRIAAAVHRAGGRVLVVGGYVRDVMLGGVSRGEPDLEVFGLELRDVIRVLRRFGRVRRIGRAFPVLRVGDLAVEVSLPRRESKTGPGHRGFAVAVDPFMTFADAARRRDLTLNAMGLDPRTGELLDPYRGAADLAAGVMRATDAKKFPEDPLRALRAAAFASRFGFTAAPDLVRLCSGLDLSELSPERIADELGKLLLAPEPARGLRFLEAAGLLRFLPELAALRETPQDPEWHPEGDVFTHTVMALEAAAPAAAELDDPADRRVLMFAVLCHDLGKAKTTRRVRGRLRSPGHAAAGAQLAAAFLERLRMPGALTKKVEALTRHHLAPRTLVTQDAGARAYRRLARKLDAAGTNLRMLLRVSRADNLGRGTAIAATGRFPQGEVFRRRAEALGVFRAPVEPAVLGRHVLARQVPPGPRVGEIVRKSRELQEETGETDPDRILDRVLEEPMERRPPGRQEEPP